jgi:hypothetical protein
MPQVLRPTCDLNATMHDTHSIEDCQSFKKKDSNKNQTIESLELKTIITNANSKRGITRILFPTRSPLRLHKFIIRKIRLALNFNLILPT